jgi:hypothetical protein
VGLAIFQHSDRHPRDPIRLEHRLLLDKQLLRLVYLSLVKLTGKQYVGSTYNTRGIWVRWVILCLRQ